MIFTAEYLATAPHAELEITYPDGAIYRTRSLSDGNGMFVATIRDAIAFERGSSVVACSRHLDKIRKSHAEAATRGVPSSKWAVRS